MSQRNSVCDVDTACMFYLLMSLSIISYLPNYHTADNSLYNTEYVQGYT